MLYKDDDDILKEMKDELDEDIELVLDSFNIFRIGWEMDNEGWLVQMKDGRKEFVETSHGGYCWMAEETVLDYVVSYGRTIEKMKAALKVKNGL